MKLKYSDFTQQTRSRTVNDFIAHKKDFFPIVKELIYQEEPKQSVRLLGISITKLDNEMDTKTVSVQLKMEF